MIQMKQLKEMTQNLTHGKVGLTQEKDLSSRVAQLEKLLKEEKDNKRIIHMIPHSHTDEGWLSTSDEFFTGDDQQSIYVGGVKDMLDSVVQQLLANKNRTFVFAEIKYFKMWYEL